MQKKRFTIDGTKFHTLKTFYDEVEMVLCSNLDFKWGRNLDAFNDILWGGFGVFEYDESIELIWKNSEKSKADFGEVIKGEGPSLFDLIVDIIKDHSHIDFELE